MDPLTIIRTKRVGRFWKGPGRHKLTAVHERLCGGLPSPGTPHRASTDAVMAGRVLWHLLDKLPDDMDELQAQLAEWREEQDEDRRRYLESRAAPARPEGYVPPPEGPATDREVRARLPGPARGPFGDESGVEF